MYKKIYDTKPENKADRNTEIRNRHASGESYSQLAEFFEISSQRVGQVMHALDDKLQNLEKIEVGE